MTQRDLVDCERVLKRILTENILPFWFPHVVDSDAGGYRLNHDMQGRWRGRTNKHLVLGDHPKPANDNHLKTGQR